MLVDQHGITTLLLKSSPWYLHQGRSSHLPSLVSPGSLESLPFPSLSRGALVIFLVPPCL